MESYRTRFSFPNGNSTSSPRFSAWLISRKITSRICSAKRRETPCLPKYRGSSHTTDTRHGAGQVVVTTGLNAVLLPTSTAVIVSEALASVIAPDEVTDFDARVGAVLSSV
jgi:hypothetical protein